MSRTVHYDTNGNEIGAEDCINDAPTYAQEQLADIERREGGRPVVSYCDICKTREHVMKFRRKDGREYHLCRDCAPMLAP